MIMPIYVEIELIELLFYYFNKYFQTYFYINNKIHLKEYFFESFLCQKLNQEVQVIGKSEGWIYPYP